MDKLINSVTLKSKHHGDELHIFKLSEKDDPYESCYPFAIQVNDGELFEFYPYEENDIINAFQSLFKYNDSKE